MLVVKDGKTVRSQINGARPEGDYWDKPIDT